MKALKIILAIFAIAILVFWLGWCRAPSAKSVCKNLMNIVEEAGGGLVKAYASAEDCAKDFKMGENQGIIPYANQMKCYKNSKNISDIENCKVQ